MSNREKGGNGPETKEENEKDETLQKLEASILESKVNTVSGYTVCFQMLVSLLEEIIRNSVIFTFFILNFL